MAAVSVKAIKESDCDELADLWNRAADRDAISQYILREKVWLDPDFKDDLCLSLEVENKKVGFVTGVVREFKDQRVGYLKLLAVDPSFQGQGYGRRLVGGLEDRLKTYKVNSVRPGEAAPNYLVPGVDVRYTKAMLMFESLGYEKLGVTYNLTANLNANALDVAESLGRLESLGIEVKRLSQDDSESLEKFLEAYWPAWKTEVAVAKANQPSSLHLALKDREVVGFSAYDSNNLGTGWFGPMGTHPEYRGQGIGEVLLKLCLADIHQQGNSTAIIPWVGPVKFYSRHVGARIDRVFHRYEKKL